MIRPVEFTYRIRRHSGHLARVSVGAIEGFQPLVLGRVLGLVDVHVDMELHSHLFSAKARARTCVVSFHHSCRAESSEHLVFGAPDF